MYVGDDDISSLAFENALGTLHQSLPSLAASVESFESL